MRGARTDADASAVSGPLGPGPARQLERCVELRARIREERRTAVSPAVERALELTDMHLFLAMSYLGYTEQLCPEEEY